MEEQISRLIRQFAEAPAGSGQRDEARVALVAGARVIVESLLELAGSQEKDLRGAALGALADIIMSMHQASFTARHLEGSADRPLGRGAAPDSGAHGSRLFGEVAIERGMAQVEDVLRALNVQKREVLAGRQPRLIGEILVAEDVLGPEQVKTVLMDVRGRLLRDIEQQLTSADADEV